MQKRATEEAFNELHGLVTNELIGRIKSGTATTQDLKAAADWLSKNNKFEKTVFLLKGSRGMALEKVLPFLGVTE